MRWDGIEREFPNQVFGMLTVYELAEERFSQLVDGGPVVDGGPGNTLQESLTEDISHSNSNSDQHFVLEKYLEEFIVSNFHQVFNGELEIFRDSEGFSGQQYRTDIGTIDILAKDRRTEDFVVIELKRVQGSDQTIGQILRYMGWVKEHLSRGSHAVRGMVICQSGDERLEYALSVIPNVDAKFYRVDFQADGFQKPTGELKSSRSLRCISLLMTPNAKGVGWEAKKGAQPCAPNGLSRLTGALRRWSPRPGGSPEHVKRGQAGSPIALPAAWRSAAPFDDIAFRSTPRRRPRKPARTEAWSR